ncbi:MAG: hypothetical protein ACRDJM_04405 [Actinomycetota bacterium]
MKRVALFGIAVCMTAVLAVSPSHAVVGAWAFGIGPTSVGGTPVESLTVAVGKADAALGAAGLIVYQLGNAAVPISITCALWETSTPYTLLHATGGDTSGNTWYITVRDSGPGQLADSFALRTTPTAGELCSSPTTGFKCARRWLRDRLRVRIERSSSVRREPDLAAGTVPGQPFPR